MINKIFGKGEGKEMAEPTMQEPVSMDQEPELQQEAQTLGQTDGGEQEKVQEDRSKSSSGE